MCLFDKLTKNTDADMRLKYNDKDMLCGFQTIAVIWQFVSSLCLFLENEDQRCFGIIFHTSIWEMKKMLKPRNAQCVQFQKSKN